jgi:hypothetical protein
MVVFVTSERSFNEIHHLAKHLQKAVPEVTVVAQNVNTSTGNVIMGDREFLSRNSRPSRKAEISAFHLPVLFSGKQRQRRTICHQVKMGPQRRGIGCGRLLRDWRISLFSPTVRTK